MDLRLLSVNVGQPREIGTVRGEPVRSGIAKAPVAASTVFVDAANIEGDAQADLSVHGGVDKAVYCYPADHWPWWEREKAFPCRPAAFGENLTVEGADETEVGIGDRFRWGDVVLEVSQPRAPCFKFAIFAKRPDAPALMTVSGRSGWYFRVIQNGHARVAESVLVREQAAGGPSVREAFFAALHAHADEDLVRRVADAPALASSWREAVARRLRP
jgi:MOSC domain-containing protein YiiM